MNRSLRWGLGLLLPLSVLAGACSDDGDSVDAGSGSGSEVEDTTTTGGDGTTETTEAAGGDGTTCDSITAPDDAPEIVVAAQDFPESEILAQIYAQCLEAAGFTTSVQDLGGYRDVLLSGFEGGDIDLTAEYAAAMLEFLNEDVSEATNDADETTELLQGYLDDIGLVALTPSSAVDTNAFVVTQATSEELGITSISDLADHPDLVLGAPADCETNPFCLPGLEEVYGIDLSENFIPLDFGAIPAALEADEVQVGIQGSTSSLIGEDGFVLLEDDQSMLAADNVLPVLTADLAEVEGIEDLLNAISAALTTENLTALNVAVEVDLEDADAAAAAFLTEVGLL